MDKKENSDIGEQIKSIVQDAVNTMDFHKLNQEITGTVNNALGEIKKKVDFNQFNTKRENTQKLPVIYKRKTPIPVSSHPAGGVSGILYILFGSIGLGVIGTLLLCLGFAEMTTGILGANSDIAFSILFFLFGLSILFMNHGIYLRKRISRFRKYVKELKHKRYITVKELANKMGETDKFLLKDLQKMTRLNMFLEGHFDDDKTFFILDNETYDQYLNAQESLRKRQEEEKKKLEIEGKVEQEKKENTKDYPQYGELKETIQEGQAYIRKIKDVNSTIPNRELSKKLERLECITTKIFEYVEQHPEQLTEIQKFMEYYLPTTLKLLNVYKEMQAQPVSGENISSAKQEIQKTLDTINLAFENLLDSLFEDVAMDVSTDISVLKTMLAQEGLTEKDFKVK